MLARRDTRTKTLLTVTLGLSLVMLSLWAVPAFGGASDTGEGQTMSIGINFPAGEIEDGQFCQGYAMVWGGTPPYTFEWSGQFTNADGQQGPLGPDQIVNGHTASWRGNELHLKVWDDADQMDSTSVSWAWGEFNSVCEA